MNGALGGLYAITAEPLIPSSGLAILSGALIFIVSSLVWVVIKMTMGVRSSDEDEALGLDHAECGLEANLEFG